VQSGLSFRLPRLTPTVKALLIFLAAAFFLESALSVFFGWNLVPWLGFSPDTFLRDFRLWQPITYVFLHGGLWHLLFNALGIYMFAGDLEAFWGKNSFRFFCLISALGGPLLQVILWAFAGLVNPEWLSHPAFAITIGSSGIVYGLIGAYGLLFGEATVLAMGIFPMKMKVLVGAMIFVDVSQALFSSQSQIAHIFHLGGFLAGFLMIKLRGPGLRGGGGTRGGGGFRLFRKAGPMSREEMRQRLKIISNEPKEKNKGDKGLPIHWN
jgi:membrane associated rhomboid family serine protease